VRYWPDRRAGADLAVFAASFHWTGRPGAGPGIFSHRDVLASSAFCAVDTLTWSWSRHLTVEEVFIAARP
jgi:hypothetical protein